MIHKDFDDIVSVAGIFLDRLYGQDINIPGIYDSDVDPETTADRTKYLWEQFSTYVGKQFNPDAFSAVVMALEKTPVRNGARLMSWRRFRKIVNANGGFFKCSM